MPGLYTPPDYDLAGFIVGCVEEDDVLGPHRVMAGDVLVGFESSGLHTNGYSLARRIVSDRMRLGPHDAFPGADASVADVLLAVHRSYLAAVAPSLGKIHALAHITGGGLPGNLDRALPPNVDAVVDTASWERPNVFAQLERAGAVPRVEMYRAFNMGVGLVAICRAQDAPAVIDAAGAANVRAWNLGEIVSGGGGVTLT
jgi:phosphoribosylformylglycinamidine cyclo-ligase